MNDFNLKAVLFLINKMDKSMAEMGTNLDSFTISNKSVCLTS